MTKWRAWVGGVAGKWRCYHDLHSPIHDMRVDIDGPVDFYVCKRRCGWWETSRPPSPASPSTCSCGKSCTDSETERRNDGD